MKRFLPKGFPEAYFFDPEYSQRNIFALKRPRDVTDLTWHETAIDPPPGDGGPGGAPNDGGPGGAR